MTDKKYVLAEPKDIEAEQALLGAIIENNDLMDNISAILRPKSFYSEAHQSIFKAMLNLAFMNEPIDEVLLADKLKSYGRLEDIGGIAYLAELLDCAPVSGNIMYYAKIIQEHSTARDLLEVTKALQMKCRDPEQNIPELLMEAETNISKISLQASKREYKKISAVFAENFNRLEYLSQRGEGIAGLKTGYERIDKMTAGLQPTDLIIIAARPSMGKTALAMNIGSYVAKTQPGEGAVLIFSIEMTSEQLGFRLLSSESKINTKKFRTGKLDQEEWDRLAQNTERLNGIPLYINDSSKISPYEMVNITKKLDKELENGVSLVIVDYLQLIQGQGNPFQREQEIAGVTRALKGLAKDMKIPVIALSQLNRSLENRSDKRPILSDLRESGSIEQEADVIIFIYRDEVYDKETKDKGLAEILFRKHRNGPIGMVKLGFVGKYTRFYNLGEEKHANEYNVKKNVWKPNPHYEAKNHGVEVLSTRS